MNKWALGGILVVILVIVGVCSVVTWGAGQAKDFAFEQQPTAKSWGDLIGKQYSQLRALAASIDANVCKLEQNAQFREELVQTYDNKPESEWPADAREEARNLRWERTALTQVHNNLAAEYNVLRSDVRTLADNLGLEVDFIEEVKDYGVGQYGCGALKLPE